METPLRVLVACEFSGVVRDAFREAGHEAWSCDFLPTEGKSEFNKFHYQCDVRGLFPGGNIYQTMALENQAVKWDLLIAHPPCTRLCLSGVRWLHERNLWAELDEACSFFKWLLNCPVPRIAVENPQMHGYALSRIGKRPNFWIQPWMFGHGETKKTFFWTKNLPNLATTDIVNGRKPKVHHASPGPLRWKERSRFYPGIAKAMAEQWGGLK